MQAANDELRSSAEELETSKEELQSVNEELSTVNQELKITIDELRITTNDFQNFVHASRIPTIYLDRGLRVKFATTRAQDVFNVLASDVGRPLSHLTSKLTYEGILSDARQVLDRLTKIEREVRTQEQRKYLMQVQPYRTFEDRIEGVVLTFVDITTLRQAEANVIAGEERQRLLIESAVDYAIFTLRREGHIDSWNPGAERMFGYTASEVIGHHFSMLFVEADRQAGVPAAELGRAARDGRALDERYHLRKDGSTFYASSRRAVSGPGDRPAAGCRGRRGSGWARAAHQPRETEVLRLVAAGHSNKEVAAELKLSVKTVEVHKTNASRKIGLRGRRRSGMRPS